MVNPTPQITDKSTCAPPAICATHRSTLHAAALFSISIAFLIAVATMLHRFTNGQKVGWNLLAIALLWTVIVSDTLIGFLRRTDYSSQAWKKMVLLVLIPPFRMTITTYQQNEYVWLPVWGWRHADQALFDELERVLSIPMLAIAALVLPVLAVEIWGKSWLEAYPVLLVTARLCTSFIWLSFTIDFIVMVSLAENKFVYCKEHWLDIVIIMLPLIAFLRGLQLFRAARLTRLAKAARVFRLRGLAMRIFRGLLVLRIVESVLNRNPERRLTVLYSALKENEKKRIELQAQIDELEGRLGDR